MAAEIYLPQLGLTMTDAIVVNWLKTEGDPVERGEPVVEIETDKVTAEVEAPANGVLGPILAKEGAVVPIGGLLSHVLEPGEAAPAFPISEVSAVQPVTPDSEYHTPLPVRAPARRSTASPRARRFAYEMGIDLARVEATGPGGRIVEADVRWFADQIEAVSRTPISPVARRLAEELGIDLKQVQGSGPHGRILKEDVQKAARGLPLAVVPLTGVRRVVAERMTHSFTSAPHFYLSVEVEATAITRMRDGLMAKVEAAVGVRLTLTDILVKVCAQALFERPDMNVAWVDASQGNPGGVLRLADVHIGVAVATERGLVVPVIRHADALSLTEMALRREELVVSARSGELTLPDLEGGTFTLSNLGMFGVDQFSAIINPPQSAILGVGRIRERPVARDGAVVVRPTTHLTLSVDHRLLDGAQAAGFLDRVAALVEEPHLLIE